MLLFNLHKNIKKSKTVIHRLLNMLVSHLEKDPAIAPKVEKDFEQHLQTLSQSGNDLKILYSDLLQIAKMSTNFSSENFVAFPDSGNEISGIMGGITALFLQQNLINHKFCSPVATFVEMAVIKWMREYMGYKPLKGDTIHNLGGLVTTGGTISNVIAMLMARTRKDPKSLTEGIKNPEDFCIVVPKNIGHYSIKSGQMWLGCGNNILEVKTNNYRYDLEDLALVLQKNKGKIMAVIAYAGDSKTMTVENLKAVHDVVKSIDETIWLHVDACNGFCLAFSNLLVQKLQGINLYDSISMDPHKMMMMPYTASLLLVKNPKSLVSIQTYYDLIMSGNTDLGITTPFIGSKVFLSLKIWSVMQTLGRQGLAKYVENRYNKAQYLKKRLIATRMFKVFNSVDAFAVIFAYFPNKNISIKKLNEINDLLYTSIVEKQLFLHKFQIKQTSDVVSLDTDLTVFRFFSGNPGITYKDIDNIVNICVDEAKKLNLTEMD